MWGQKGLVNVRFGKLEAKLEGMTSQKDEDMGLAVDYGRIFRQLCFIYWLVGGLPGKPSLVGSSLCSVGSCRRCIYKLDCSQFLRSGTLAVDRQKLAYLSTY
jgi:hypothetical protein